MTGIKRDMRAPNPHLPHRQVRGFTLIELMIVVAVVAILVSIAMASYTNSAVKTRRTTAMGCMTERAQFMERFYTVNLRYDQTTAGVAFAFPPMECVTGLADSYTFAFNGGAPGQNTYTLTATPRGSQEDRDECGILTLTNTGVKGAEKPTGCW